MRLASLAWLLGAGLTLVMPAAAQKPAAQDKGNEIVVTGTRDAERQVRDFVGALTQAPPGGQLSRFESAICPTAVGVSPKQKEAVIRRIRRVADAAGMAVGGADCTPNLLLVVTGEKRAFIEALWERHAYYFGDMSAGEVRRLAREPGPAAAWQVAGALLTADGFQLKKNRDDLYINKTARTGSRITAGARPQFAAAAVVVEMKALDGLTTTQLADYAAMRAFASTDPSRLPGEAPTILKVLEAPMGSEIPITLTAWDLAFLRSLHAAPDNVAAAAQRSQIRRSLRKEIDRPEGSKD